MYATASDKSYLSNVQVMNNLVDTEDMMTSNSNVCYVVIGIKASQLISLLDLDQEIEELASLFPCTND